MNKRTINKHIALEYYEDSSLPEQGLYKGGPISPEEFDDLSIISSQDGDKFQVHIKGSKKSLEVLGKYLINLSNYETVDPDYHTHFDDLDNIMGNTELIIHHPNSNFK